MSVLSRLFGWKGHSENQLHTPLVRLGQGDFTRDISPEDLAMPARTPDHAEQLNLRFLTREPAEVYHAKAKDNLSSHWLAGGSCVDP